MSTAVASGCCGSGSGWGPYGTSQRSVRSSVTRCSRRSRSCAHGDGPRGQLEEGEHLGHRGDDLGDGGGLVVRGLGVGDRPGVEEGDPAAQYGAVVTVPGAQAPAGARDVAVHLDEAGEPGGVPVVADLIRGQPQFGGGPFGGRVGQGAPAVGRRRRRGRAAGRGRPSGRRGPRRPAPERAILASSAGAGVPSGGRGAGRRERRWFIARGAAARGRGRTSRSLESRGIRDVTGAVFRLTVRKPKRNVTGGHRAGQGRGFGRGLRGAFKPVVQA